jgi:iron complex transport system substrate-binding protein
MTMRFFTGGSGKVANATLTGLALPAIVVALVVAITTTNAQSQPARRIVSLVPSLTETLFAIGAGGDVVAVDSFATYPPEVKNLPKVGALVDPDVEKILSLRPDLVITYGSQASLEGQLARASIKTYSYRHGGISAVLDSIRDMGRASGHAREADTLVQQISTRLDALRAKVKGRPRPCTLLVIDRQPGALRGLYASGGSGFMHEMLEAAGGDNVFASSRIESVQPSTETLLARAPQVILEIRAEGLIQPTSAQAERNVWSTLPSIPAVRDNKIYLLSGNQLVVPGPRLAQGAEDFARALHPEVFVRDAPGR